MSLSTVFFHGIDPVFSTVWLPVENHGIHPVENHGTMVLEYFGDLPV
jgi:hypothetical protein